MSVGRSLTDWSYGGDPANNQVDEVRMLVGDTDPSRKLITDTEIEYYISKAAEVYEAAYNTALAIRASMAKLTSKSGRDFSEDASKAFDHYTVLADDLLLKAPMAIPRAPQLSRADRDSMRQNSDLIQPSFGGGMLSEDADAIRPNTRTTRSWDQVLDD